jgi:hypothetical protein
MVRSQRVSLFAALVLVAAIATVGMCVESKPAQESASEGSNALLERLVRIPGQMQALQTSSHNKQGQNGDADIPLYKDARGDDVIFDAAGPGCVRSIWGTYFLHDAALNFYFDGEQEPRYRINEIEFFSGKHPGFPAPLNSYERRGYYGDEPFAGNSFVPIPFSKSLKITITRGSRFFHVLYELYPYGTPVESFTGKEDRSSLLRSFEHLGDMSSSPEGDVQTISETVDASKEEVVLLERKGSAGVVRAITIEADDLESLFQDTLVVMRWDGHMRNDVHTATGIFFGSANRAYDVAALPVAVKKLPGGRVRLDCRFPMPFWREARIALRNRSGKPLGRVDSKVVVGPNPISEANGAYFTALYRKGQTTYGRDWPLYDSPGAGWFVGVVQSMQHEHYCEGNEHFTVDGAVSPQINGTGTEDYYLGCFWPNRHYSSPFATCAGDIQAEAGGDTAKAYALAASYARFHLEAPIPFFRSIDARIQHGGVSNILSNYRSVAFCYLRRRPALRQTDFLDVGGTASEKAHGYTAGGSELTGLVTARPEGEYFETADDEDGRRHSSGEIQFTVAIDPKNNGVRIRRRLDQAGMPQTANVFVDGAYAGTWRHAYQNEHLRWFDSDFDLAPHYTKDKTSLTLKLEIVSGPDCGVYTDFQYGVFCFE